MTPEEQRNIDLAKLWEETYNTDIRRLVYDCYAADCAVNDGFVRGQAQLLQAGRRQAGLRRPQLRSRRGPGRERAQLCWACHSGHGSSTSMATPPSGLMAESRLAQHTSIRVGPTPVLKCW